MRFAPRLPLLMALLPLLGCGPLQNRDLKDVLIERVMFITHTQAQWVKLEPVYTKGMCPRLANAKAHINGAAAVADSLGDYEPPVLWSPERCVNPEWRLEGPPPSDVTSATATIADRTATITMTVENPYAERRLTLVSPADRKIRRGEEVVLRWSVATDVLDARIPAYFNPEGGGTPFNTSVPVIEGDLVRVRIPDDAALGRGVLVPVLEGRPRITRCEGARTCYVDTIIETDIWSQQLEIVP